MIDSQQNRIVIFKASIAILFLLFLLKNDSFAETLDTYVTITNQTTDGSITNLTVDIKLGNHTGGDVYDPMIHFCEPISHEFHYGPGITTAVISDGSDVILQGTISVPNHVADIYNKKGKLYLMVEYEHTMNGENVSSKEMYSTPLLGP